MHLYVTRHSQSLGGASNLIDDNSSPLDDKNGLSIAGKKQAQKLAEKLSKYRVDLIIVSPYKRTRETIGPYLKKHPTKIIVSDLIVERDTGVFAGKPKNSLKEYCLKNKILDRVSFKPDNGESILEVYARALKFLKYLKSNFKKESILVCSHTNFLRCLDIAIRKQDIMYFYSGEEIKHGEIKEYDLT